MKRHRRLLRTAAPLVVCALVLSACSLQKHYGVSTHTYPVKGNCNTSRVDAIGAALPLSGAEAPVGKAYLTGVKMAVTQVNDSHGIMQNHTCLELLYKDIGTDQPHVGDQAVLDLVNGEGVNFLVAPFESSVVQFTGSDLGLSGIPSTTSSSLNMVRQPKNYPMTFPTGASTSLEASALAKYARAQHWSSLAVAALNDPAGKEELAELKADVAKTGGSVVATLKVPAKGAFSADKLTSLRDAHPNALVVLGDTLQVAKPLVARVQLGWTVPTLVGASAANASVLRQLGANGANGVYALVPKAVVLSPKAHGPSDPSMIGFVRRLKAELHVSTLPNSVIPYAEGYDSVEMLATAATTINSSSAANVQTYLQTANYPGLLASYNFTSNYHGGVSARQLTVAALNTLSNGFFRSAPSGSKSG